VLDTHTAVASSVYYKYAEESGDRTPTAVISTASPYKFYTAVLKACGAYKEGASDEEQIAALNSISGVAVPQAVKAALTNPVRHDHVVEIAGMEGKVKAFLNID
ncbi:MAG: threonine synthase, partial [Parasporobacterium sp.]|nr:threonine synthase [Parasporobacterium sp.]